MTGIRLVSYDFWATLARGHSAHLHSRVELLAAAFGGVPFETTRTALRTVDADLDRRTELTGAQYGFAERIAAIGAALGADPLAEPAVRRLEERFGAAHLARPPSLTDPALPAILARLRADGRSVAVTSNTAFIAGRLLRTSLDHLGLGPLVEHAVFSDEVGAAKPAPAIYARLTAATGVEPAEILHIGDNRYTDYDGARAAGLHALWYRPSGPPDETTLVRHNDILGHRLLS